METYYQSMDKSYPDVNYNSIHPRQALNNSINPSKFKVINDLSESTIRTDIPQFHNFPKSQHNIPPMSHMLGVNNNQNHLKDIFGDYQTFNNMKTVEFNTPSPTSTYQYNPNSNLNPITTPKMKFFEDVEHHNIFLQNDKKTNTYNAIADYFNGFTMTKTEVHGKYSIYKSVVQCLLCIGVRYIVAIVSDDNSPIGTRKMLSNLKWESFQTRSSNDDIEVKKYGLTKHSYSKPDQTILDDNIKLIKRNNFSDVFMADNLPIQVEILKDKEDEHISEHGTISSALELFSTVITFI